MTARIFLSASLAATAAIFAAPASAGELHLTATQIEQAGEACRAGTPLIPVRSDFGTETGQYALPLFSERSGQPNSAIILDSDTLETLPECQAQLTGSVLGAEPAQTTAIS